MCAAVNGEQLIPEEIPLYYGFLKRKLRESSVKKWNGCYVTIRKNSLQVYKKSASKDPDYTFYLQNYAGLEIAASKSNSWVFKLLPESHSPVLTFAANSKAELTLWLLQLKGALQEAHNEDSSKARDFASKLLADPSVMVTLDSIVPFHCINKVPPPIIKPPTSNNDLDQWYNDSIFLGDRDEARKVMITLCGDGTFLVRHDPDGRQVLTVGWRDLMLKYVLVNNSKTCIGIKGQDQYFDDLPSLLQHYKYNYLPTNQPDEHVLLITPYKLADIYHF